jgi:hypothetical protein
MKYFIRDDDTSFFTSKKDLVDAYSDIWIYGPVNLAVIPYVVKTENHGIIGKYVQDPSIEYFIGDNVELVCFLKELIEENKITIMLHGFNHYYKPTNDPFYPFGIPEFLYTNNQYDKIAKGKTELEQLFGCKIKWFIPPSNALSNETILACDKLGLNIPLVFDLKKRSLISLIENPFNLIVNRVNKYFNSNFPLYFKNHKEIKCVSYTSVSDFLNVRNEKNMVIATHYWEVNKIPNIKIQILQDIAIYGNKIYSMNEI